MLLLHIIIALASLSFSTYLLFSPSKTKLRVGYSLVAATIASGTYIAISTHARMLQTCVTGLVYLGFVSLELVVAYRKLAKETVRID